VTTTLRDRSLISTPFRRREDQTAILEVFDD
jgi:hypothetical protein